MIPTGLLGGSFNPAHRGHRRVSAAAIRALGLDELWWLVSPGNPLKAAEGMAQAEGPDAMRQASIALRGSCDACHALYLRKYEPPKVLEADRNFDFDAVLPKR